MGIMNMDKKADQAMKELHEVNKSLSSIAKSLEKLIEIEKMYKDPAYTALYVRDKS